MLPDREGAHWLYRQKCGELEGSGNPHVVYGDRVGPQMRGSALIGKEVVPGREQNEPPWATMALAENILDIFVKNGNQ